MKRYFLEVEEYDEEYDYAIITDEKGDVILEFPFLSGEWGMAEVLEDEAFDENFDTEELQKVREYLINEIRKGR